MTSYMRSIWNGPPVWYFAYGSNMSEASMTKRGITPLDAKAVQVPGYYLNFDLFGTPFSEPCFASIDKFPNADDSSLQLEWDSNRIDISAVCGIAYLISPEDFHRVLSTEDGGVVYEVLKITATILDSGLAKLEPANISVYTLKAKYPRRPNGVPSLRYMTLLRDGAAVMKLPKDYLEYLNSLPDFSNPKPEEEPKGTWIFTHLINPVVLKATNLHKYKVDEHGKCPCWIAIFLVLLYKCMWAYHDYIHQHIFSHGGGGQVRYVNQKKSLH